MNPLFVFAVDTTLPRGDSTHVREFVEHIARECPSSEVFTYNDVNINSRYLRLLVFRVLLLWRYVTGTHRKVYLRYFPAIFVDMIFLKLLRRDVYVELNAVISDEAEDLGRSPLLRLITRIDEKCICAFSKALVSVTPEIQRYYSDTYGKRESYSVNNGVNTRLFDPDHASFSEDMKTLQGHFVIGFVGSLSPWQDFSTLIDAVDELVNRRGYREFRCVIVGTGSEESAVKSRIASLGLQDFIIMTGRRKYEDIPGYISLFSVAVAPLKGSRTKNTGSAALKVFEYLAMEKPVILADVGTFSDMIHTEGVGLVYRSNDHKDLARKIADVYLGETVVEPMKKRARNLVVERYSWAAAVQETLDIMGIGRH